MASINSEPKNSIYDLICKYYMKATFIVASLLFIYVAGFGHLSDMAQRCALVTLVCPPLFLKKPLKVGKEKKSYWWTKTIDILLCIIMVAGGIYMIVMWPSKLLKSTPYVPMDYILGILMIISVLEATRRGTGLAVTLTSFVFLLYTRFGYIFGGILGHRGESWKRIISTLYVSTEGIFGSSVGIAAGYIILFIVFGAFLDAFGTGRWFIDFAYSLTGRFRGGPAKTAVVSSGLMGMISGASVANVVTTGSFTIPLMKKMGYKPHEAGAVESVASTGGMIMPPIMGAGAFLMADFLETQYGIVAGAAAIPAVLFYISLILATDATAVKRGLRGLQKEELPKLKDVMRERGLFVIPIIALIVMICLGYSASKSCVISIISILVVACFRKDTLPTVKRILTALEEGGKGAASIVVTTSCVGIIVCALTLTGLSARLSTSLISIAQGNIYIGAVIAAVITIILGCGMPPAAVYIILASILAPSLIGMGAVPIAAHMFIFYFSCIGTITPPVAITSYTGAAIAEANPNKTGWTAFRYGLVAYIIPFMFLTAPQLLLVGGTGEIIIAAFSALIGVVCLCASLEGYMIFKFFMVPRVILGIASLLTLYPGLTTDLIGYGLIAVAIVLNLIIAKKKGTSIKVNPAQSESKAAIASDE